MTANSAIRLLGPAASVPLGTSYLAGEGIGVDLAPLGYVEEEFLVRGTATEWTYDSTGAASPRTADVPYCTRVLLRRPADPARFSGVIQVEPLHPDLDSALTWRGLYPWITRTGGAWVGITQDSRMAGLLRDSFDPARYQDISIPLAGLGYDIVGGVAQAMRAGTIDIASGLADRGRVYLSGWSITGSFCRVFLGDGFDQRYRLSGRRPVFDGYVVAISSGGAGSSGYPPISSGTGPPGPADPRRTIGRHDVPVIEFLSEFESETHASHLRPDSDAPADRYRLYQVAGTSHINHDNAGALTNAAQCRARGLPTDTLAINETRSDARQDFVARAVFALLDRWVAEGQPPPRVAPFQFAPDDDPLNRTPAGARALLRDGLGNVLAGIRTPWVEAPVGRYGVHSTPAPEATSSPSFPQFTPAQRAALVGYLELFDPGQLHTLYGTRETYLARYRASCTRLVGEGLLLEPEAHALLQRASGRELPLS
jgi:hypothetical protein